MYQLSKTHSRQQGLAVEAHRGLFVFDRRVLAVVTRTTLRRMPRSFDHHDCLYEIRYDGFARSRTSTAITDEERGPAVSEEAKKVRRKIIRELRPLGYQVGRPVPIKQPGM